MFHESRRLMMLLDDPTDPTEHGWEVDGKVKWSVNYFPDDIDDLLLYCEKNDDRYDNDIMMCQTMKMMIILIMIRNLTMLKMSNFNCFAGLWLNFSNIEVCS